MLIQTPIEKEIPHFASPDSIKFGYHIENDEVEKILTLGFEVKEKLANDLAVFIPSYRHDVEREIDLIEEVARIYGYNKIPEVSKISVTLEEKVDHSAFVDKTRMFLQSLGFYEIITNSFISEEIANRFGKPIHVLNPQSSELSHIRPSLLPGMLITISNNLKVNERDLQLFEIGKVFEKSNERKIESFDDFTETEQLLMVLSGNLTRTEWFESRPVDVYDIKELLNHLLTTVPAVEFDIKIKHDSPYFESVLILMTGNKKWSLGKLKKSCAIFDVNRTYMFFR